MRLALLLSLLWLDVFPRCGTRPTPPRPPRVVKLLAGAEEKETTARTEAREDVEFQNAEQGRTGFIVARGESPVLERGELEARLYGDEALSRGFEVDNVILLEVLDLSGKVTARAAVGFTDGLSIGSERIDLLGRQAFAFEPGEVNLSGLLPEGPFRLRATVLDNSGVGRVSDVYLSLQRAPAPPSDDLRNQ